MIAAARRRTAAARAAAGRRLRGAVPATRRLDRAVDRQLQRAWPLLARGSRAARSASRSAARRLRPLAALLFRLLALVERLLLRAAAISRRAATAASAVITPQRAICLTIFGAAACLIAAQFVEYRAVELGQQGYAGLPAAEAPTTGGETAGAASAYLLVPVGLLAAALAGWAALDERRRGLGRVVFALGLLSLATILIVDLPAGLDVGSAAARFSGAEAVLYDAFYAQIAAAGGLILGGLLLSGKASRIRRRHGYRPRKPSLARTQGGRRSARTSSA